MAYEFVQVERSGHVATITLNRPERLNALSAQLTQELHHALDVVAQEFPDRRVVILTGAGRGFCSGADVGAQADALNTPVGSRPPAQETESSEFSGIPALSTHLHRIPQATIAAVNGVAAGAGFALTLACDIRVASEAARFSCIFIKRSLVPDTGSSYTMASVAGMGLAAEMALTGRVYDAQWAYRTGLVNYLMPPDQCMEKARELAEEIASNPPLAMRAAKHLLYAHGPDLPQVIQREGAANAPHANSEDRREAVMSFMEKRQPVYKGR